MVTRQPGRPSPEQFIASATRYIENMYLWYNPASGLKEYDSSQEAIDVEVIQREMLWDGYAPGVELLQFASVQLAYYRNLKR